MTKRLKNWLKSIDETWFLLGTAILIGVFIRLYPVLRADFPINDGGMFFTMIKDLQANHYRLPETTTYNNLSLPYAYPPLSFYMAGLISDLTTWNLIDIIRIFPSVFTILAIPAFFFLAKNMLANKVQIILATYIFIFIPASFDWQIMGGGLTRAPAFFFSILSLTYIYRIYKGRSTKDLIFASFFSSLTVLTHPEFALHTAVSALLFCIMFGRNISGLIRTLIVGGATLLITSPWWLSVVTTHGITPFLAAGGTSFHSIGELVRFFTFDLTHEFNLQTIGTLALIGMFLQLSKREWLIPVWVIVTFLSEPRSATYYLSPALAMLASYSLINLLLTLNGLSTINREKNPNIHPLAGKISKIFFAILSAQWTYSCLAIMIVFLNTNVLSNADAAAFEWVKQNTPAESHFLVLTGEGSPFADPVSEWFPTLAERESVATVQGKEWLQGHSFNNIVVEAMALQKCQYLPYDCIDDWLERNNREVDYLYLQKPLFDTKSGGGVEFDSQDGDQIQYSGKVKLVYNQGDINIYKVKYPKNDPTFLAE